MGRDDGRSKSARRKPLRDVSNGGIRSSKSAKKLKNNNKEEEEQLPEPEYDRTNEDPLDHLLLAHSDFSSLLRQIDELVVQAVKVKATVNKKSKEIRTFANLLSEIHSSLKPSVLGLEEALAACHTEPEIRLGETSVGAPTIVDEGDEHGADTPEPTKQDLLVSPSPLVSWRAADCMIERGKQLFLLTPLPRPRTSISQKHASFKPTPCGGFALNTTSLYTSLCTEASEPNHGMAKPVATNVEKNNTTNVESNSDLGFASPLKIPVGEYTVLTTPCLKIPPRSCALLEPDCTGKSDKPHMSTPYPVGNKKVNESTDSESSSGEVSEKLGLKYPELIGIRPSCMLGNGNKALEASPAWIMSPPKCCTLLEPPDEKPLKEVEELAVNFSQQICLAPIPPKESSIQINDQEKKIHCGQDKMRGSFAAIESTPLWKEPQSTIHRGKRPGENTLKKELWTRFEAASMGGLHLNLCASQDTSHKGFLDRLEEASCDEASPHPDSSR